MKSILYLCPNGFVGGAEKVVLELLRCHAESGAFDVHIMFFNDGPAVEMAKEISKVSCNLLPFQIRLSRPWTYLKAVGHVRKYIKKNKIDIVHSTMPYAHLVGGASSLGLSTKSVWFQHGPVGGSLDLMATLFPVDLMFFNSTYLKNAHEKMVSFFKPKNGDVIVPLGVEVSKSDDSEVKEIRNSLVEESDHFLIGTAGRITPSKGQEVLIRAAIKFRENRPLLEFRKLKVVIVGDPSDKDQDIAYKKYLEDIVEMEGLRDNVKFIPFQKDVRKYMGAFDLFVHTCKIPEAFGLVVAEAMVEETTVVGSNLGGTTDYLVDGENGFLYNAWSDKASGELYLLMYELMNSREKRESIAKRGRQTIVDNYTMEHMKKTVESSYTEILKS